MTTEPRMTDEDIAKIRTWLNVALAEPQIREWTAVLLREVELARGEEKRLRRQLDQVERENRIAWHEELD